MWNCSFDNRATSGAGGHGMYGEDKYAKYYTNLTSLQQQTMDSAVVSRRERGQGLSGPGSTAEETLGVRAALPVLLRAFGIRSIVDVPCGDFNYMRAVLQAEATPTDIDYTGLDIVSNLVQELQGAFGGRQRGSRHHLRFGQFDLATQYLPPADLIVLRDVLFHFDVERVRQVLRRIDASGCRYALITYFPSHSVRASSAKFHAGRGFKSYGSWNLEDEPFHLPPPLLAIGRDGTDPGRVMGLWPCPLLRQEHGSSR